MFGRKKAKPEEQQQEARQQRDSSENPALRGRSPLLPIEALFPVTGLTDYEKKVAAEAGLDAVSIKQAIDEPSTTEEAYAKIMGNLVLSEGDKRKLMSDLSPRDIHLFSVSYARAKLFNNEVLENFLNQELMLRVSKKRLGRGEIIKLSGAIREHEMKKSWWRRMGMFGRGAEPAYGGA